MASSDPVKFGLILSVIVLVVILGILTELITIPVETITTTTTVAKAPTITTTTTPTIAIVPTTTTTTTTIPVMIIKSYCEKDKCWLYEGESLYVTKEDNTYLITLAGVTDEDTAVFEINGETDSFDQGEDKIVKGLGIYLMKVFYLPKEEQWSFVQFLFY